MMVYEIHHEVLDKRLITTKRNQQMTLFEQKAYVHLQGEPYPKETRVTLWPDRETGEEPTPLKKGKYKLSMASFSVGRFNELVVKPALEPMATAAKAGD